MLIFHCLTGRKRIEQGTIYVHFRESDSGFGTHNLRDFRVILWIRTNILKTEVFQTTFVPFFKLPVQKEGKFTRKKLNNCL